jgi:hypothetical protein
MCLMPRRSQSNRPPRNRPLLVLDGCPTRYRAMSLTTSTELMPDPKGMAAWTKAFVPGMRRDELEFEGLDRQWHTYYLRECVVGMRRSGRSVYWCETVV